MVESSRTCERDFLRGIARYARTHGPWTFYHKPKFYLASNHRTTSISQIQRFNPDGIILSDVEKMDDILNLGRPTIVHTFKSDSYNVPMVLGDTQQTGRMGADHLMRLGFKHYAYCGIGNYYWSKGRYLSFRKTIDQAGFNAGYYELNPRRMRDARQKELKYLVEWLESLPKPLGLMACADDCSQYIVEACKISNLHIPEQISIIGVDNDDMICEFSNPALSSIALNFEAAGYQSAKLLNYLISDGHAENKSITVKPTHIEVRSSTDILAIDDPDVVAAVRYIRMHGNHLIQTADVMNEVTCCQRLLHTKFKQILGRSVHQEIKRVHIERIAKLLRETDLSISQIAHKLGYSNANHLARYFHEQMSITPLGYRKTLKPL
jgi:LacI family transcriptional regulator